MTNTIDVEPIDDDGEDGAESVAITITPEMSMPALLDTMLLVDAGIADLTDAQLEQIGAILRRKVDNYFYFQEKCDAEIERLAERERAFAKTRTSIERVKSRLDQLLLFHMRKQGMEKMSGVDMTVHIKRTKSSSVQFFPHAESPDAQTYVTMGDKFVKRQYTWRKSEVKKALKSGNVDELKSIAYIEEKTSEKLDWKVRKGIDDDE